VIVGISAPALGLYYVSHLEASPITGRRRFMTVSPEQEMAIAQQSYNQVMQQYGQAILPSSHPYSRLVTKVMKRLIAAAGMEDDASWEVHVIQSDEKNAFVLPGGKVFVFSGILPVCQGEDGLATVLGHETGHQLCRHIAEKMSFSVIVAILKVITAMFIDPSVLTHSVFAIGLDLPFSRKCESEADYVGLLLMSQACYNPEEAVHLWERMAQESQGAANVSFISTHPAPRARIKKIQQWIPEAKDKQLASDCVSDLGHYSEQFRDVQRRLRSF
jgi:predicted Zn-dependent protease